MVEFRRARPGAVDIKRRVLTVSGTQQGMSKLQSERVIVALSKLALAHLTHTPITEVHHGCCVGADEQMHELIRRHFPSIKIHGHPSDIPEKTQWDILEDCDVKNPPAPPLTRNKWMIDVSYYLIAAPMQPRNVTRSGTWATIRYALKKLNPVNIYVFPNS